MKPLQSQSTITPTYFCKKIVLVGWEKLKQGFFEHIFQFYSDSVGLTCCQAVPDLLFQVMLVVFLKKTLPVGWEKIKQEFLSIFSNLCGDSHRFFNMAAHLFRFLHAFCACLVAQPRRTFVVLFSRAAHLFRFLHAFCACLVAQPRCTFVVLFARAARRV